MCGPSIEAKRMRDARVGDVLHPNSFGELLGGIGFAEKGGDPETAICTKTGTRLRLANIPFIMQNKLGIGAEADVLFVEGKDTDESGYHTDTLEFENGAWVRMQDLDNAYAYICATVLALPGEHSDRQNTREPATINA